MSAEPFRLHVPPHKPSCRCFECLKSDEAAGYSAPVDRRDKSRVRRSPVPADLAGERLIDRAEFQALLGIGQATFERWLAMGRLPEPIRLSRTCHRWRLPEVQAWIAARCPDPGRDGR